MSKQLWVVNLVQPVFSALLRIHNCLLMESLDSGDTRTLTEAKEEKTAKEDEIQPEDDTPQV